MSTYQVEPEGLNDGMPPTHPGEMLQEELGYLKISPSTFAEMIGVPTERLIAVLDRRRDIDGELALRIARCLGTTPQFWMNLQSMYEIRVAEEKLGATVNATVRPLDDAVVKASDAA